MAAQVTAQYVTRTQRCEEHGIEYIELFDQGPFVQTGRWVGQCERCAEDERMSLWADNELQKPEESAQIARQLVSAEATPEHKAKLSSMKAARLDELMAAYREAIEPSVYCEAVETLRAETLVELEYQRKLVLIQQHRERR